VSAAPVPPILVATDNRSDAETIRKLLDDEFPTVATSTEADAAARDFERHRPGVLVLGFNTLEKAERYYLGLYRLCPLVQQLDHRTVILCNKDELKRVYELCKKHYFDDYVLFWPMTYDMTRLAMTVHHALRELVEQSHAAPSRAQFAVQAQRIGQLEGLLDARLAAPEVNATPPLKAWASDLRRECAPHLAAARTLGVLAGQVKPTVLVVDDDDFQRSLIGRILDAAGYRLQFAASGLEALNLMRKSRPDLVLMDVQMPGMDGVEATRRLKGAPHTAAIPILMITGRSELDTVRESLKAGAAGFVVKPFERETLIEKIRQALETPAS